MFCNVLVAKDEPEHDRVCDVKVVKGLYVHNFTSVKFGGSNLQRKILEKRCVANFANNSKPRVATTLLAKVVMTEAIGCSAINRLQILLFCQQ
jgi:hypothetical protein